ncbi:alanyl-tRNA editing protein [Rhodosalinus sp. FB01]|uniref:alanyl-tRNA editing protein n=1 Tax=Rhodosalinus sp. FB01 TaxID=3239194 RepID=UPI003524F6AD
MTRLLYREDPYLKTAPARVAAVTPEGGVVLDATLFYPTGGGQPGDSGTLEWEGGALRVATTVKGEGDAIVLVPDDGDAARPPVGAAVVQTLDWARRHAHMRVHTALHLLSVVLPLPVTGGAIGEGKGRLDFDMPEAPEDKAALEAELDTLVARDLPVTEDWITDEELAANPGLVKTMSVAPPSGAGRVRLVRIGAGEDQVDLQPCGGTHVARTGEIGGLRLGKIEKKGRQNRRVTLHLAD